MSVVSPSFLLCITANSLDVLPLVSSSYRWENGVCERLNNLLWIMFGPSNTEIISSKDLGRICCRNSLKRVWGWLWNKHMVVGIPRLATERSFYLLRAWGNKETRTRGNVDPWGMEACQNHSVETERKGWGENISYSLPLSSRSAPLGPNQKASKAGFIEVSFSRHNARQRHQKKDRDCVSVQIQRNQYLQGHASHYEDIQKRHSCLNPELFFSTRRCKW